MDCFRGILWANGSKINFHLYINRSNNKSYIADFFYNKNHRADAIINQATCEILDRIYTYRIYNCPNDEILIVGQEILTGIRSILSCIFQPSFFVATNKLLV